MGSITSVRDEGRRSSWDQFSKRGGSVYCSELTGLLLGILQKLVGVTPVQSVSGLSEDI